MNDRPGEWYPGTALPKGDKSKAIREMFDLPREKALVYYKSNMNANSKCAILRFRVLQMFDITDFWAIIELETEDGYTVKIHSMYLKQMQSPKFINEVQNEAQTV